MKKSTRSEHYKRIEEIYSDRGHFGPTVGKNTHAAAERKQDINHEEHLASLEQELSQEWSNKSIPDGLCEVYRSFISQLPSRKAIVFATKEIYELKSYNSLAQTCLKGIFAREESLQSIKEMNEYLGKAKDWEEIIDIKLECAEILHAHRMLTLNVSENIEQWKESFRFEINDFRADFMYNGVNYLEKLYEDLDFLKYSELAKVFKFSTTADPFLIAPSKVIEKKRGKVGNSNYFMHNGQVIIPLPTLMVKRVQKMEHFIKSASRPNKILPKSGRKSRSVSPNLVKRSNNNELIGKQAEIIGKSLIENIYREEIAIQINEVVNSQLNEFIARQITINLDGVIEPLLVSIVEGVVSEMIGQKYDKSEDLGNIKDIGTSRNVVEGEENQRTEERVTRKTDEDDKRGDMKSERKLEIKQEINREKLEDQRIENERIALERKRAEEIARQNHEMERKRIEEEAEMNKAHDMRIEGETMESERRRKKLEEVKRIEEESKAEAEKKRLEDIALNKYNEKMERKRIEDEMIFKQAEEKRIEDEKKEAEEKRKEDERKKIEEFKRNEEETQRKKEELKKHEEEVQRKKEELNEKKRKEELQKREEEAQRKKIEDELILKKAEEKKLEEERKAAEKKRKEEVRKHEEEIKKKKIDDELILKRAEEKRVEEEKKEAKRKKKEDLKKLEEEIQRKKIEEQEKFKKRAEEKKIKELELKKQEEEKHLKEEMEKNRLKEEALARKREEEIEKKRLKEEALEKKREEERKKELEQKRIEDERNKKQELELKEIQEKNRIAEEQLNRRSSMNAGKLRDSMILEGILRMYIEELILELDLETISSITLKETVDFFSQTATRDEKRRLTLVLFNMEQEVLQESIFASLLEDFVQETWLETLVLSLVHNSQGIERRLTLLPLNDANQVVEEAVDYVLEVFTPGVHSPNEVQSPVSLEEEFPEFPSPEGVGLIKVMSEGKNSGKYELEAMSESSRTIKNTLLQYYESLYQGAASCYLHPDQLIEAAEIGEDCCWYWYRDVSDIVGCLIFSSTTYNSCTTSVIHHISTINLSLMPGIIRSSRNLLTQLGFSHVLVQFNSDLHPDLQVFFKDFQILHLQWGNSNFLTLESALVNSSSKNNAQDKRYLCKIKAESSITLLPEPVAVNNSTKAQMTHIGNRHCLLNSILQAFGEVPLDDLQLPQMPSIRLQRDILELLEIISSLEPFQYPYISSPPTSSSTQDSYSSSLNLNLRWLGSSYVPQQVADISYKFIRIPNATLRRGDEKCLLYTIPTDTPGVKAFFLVYPEISKELDTELKGFKTDLFQKIDNILKSINGEELKEDVWVPGFQKDIEWDMCWMHGFEIPRQHEEDRDRYVYSCIEKASISMDFPVQANALIKYSNAKPITGEFVFGIIEENIERILELPLFACLVKQNDWIKC